MDLLELPTEIRILAHIHKNTKSKDFVVVSNLLDKQLELYVKDIKHIDSTSGESKIFFRNGSILVLDIININEARLSIINSDNLADPVLLIQEFISNYTFITEYELDILINDVLEYFIIIGYGQTGNEDDEVFIELEHGYVVINTTTLEVTEL